jgi:DNA modification methylase
VIAGHGRLAAAILLGIEQVPTIRLDQLTEAQVRAYILADNKLAEDAEWDLEILTAELQDLAKLDFNLETTGFETAEIDFFIQGGQRTAADDLADQLPEVGAPISRPGDLWILGKHRVLCGDATSATSLQHLLDGKKAQAVVTDPPYNVPIDGNVCGSGSIRHREFIMASGQMTDAQFVAFLNTVCRNLVDFSTDGSLHYLFMDWRHIGTLLSAVRDVYTEFKNLCVWNKDNGGMGSLYRSKHELVAVFKNGTAPHINNVELGKYGRNRTNVWDYAGINSLHGERLDLLAMHPTVKPVALIADAILDCTKRNGIVVDSFAGSGTTLIAAEKTGRRAYVMELDPIYVDVAINRFEKFTGEEAVHGETGLTFAEIRLQRAGEIETNKDAAK